MRDIADPNIESEWSPGLTSLIGSPGVCHGLEEIAAATREWLAAWDRYSMTAEDFIETENGIAVLMCLHARAATTDLVLEQPVGAVWTLRDGKAVHVRYYDERTEALEAAGLRE